MISHQKIDPGIPLVYLMKSASIPHRIPLRWAPTTRQSLSQGDQCIHSEATRSSQVCGRLFKEDISQPTPQLRHLTLELVQSFRSNGFLVVDGFLESEVAAQLRCETLAMHERGAPPNSWIFSMTPVPNTAPKRSSLESHEGLHTLYNISLSLSCKICFLKIAHSHYTLYT